MRFLTGLLALVLAAGPAAALSLIRDAEIEATVRRIADPIVRVAGFNPAMVRVYIVDAREPNAFVAGGQNVFVHTGLLTGLDTIDELRAVIAHELGHLAGGHLTRRDEALGGARGIAAIGMIGAAAAVAGGVPQASIAIASGAGQIAQRSAFAHSRAEEAAADQAGLRFLAAAGGDPTAMLDVLARFRGQDALSGRFVDPYVQNHPLWSERIALIEERVAQLPPGAGPSAEDEYWHARMVAKLKAFTGSPAQTLRDYPEADTSDAARLARAVAWHRRPEPARAAAEIAALAAGRPDDAFLLDLQGQILLESGDAAGAATAWRRAVTLAPRDPQILGGLGRALLNTGDERLTREARDALARSAEIDRANGAVLRDLALAEARLGNEGAAALATAERFTLEGRFADAHRNAVRAAALLPEGSPGWRRAEDLARITRRSADRSRGRK